MLTLKNDSSSTWYPASIESLNSYLKIFIKSNTYFSTSKTNGLCKNISYTLQYIEFLERILLDINLSSVLYTQNIKSFIVNGASVIEAIFYYLVTSSGHGAITEWASVTKFKTSEYKIHDDNFINETEIFQKFSPPKLIDMTFDKMCKKVEKKKLLGEAGDLYKEISRIKKLRNKIHIHGIEHSLDTDWWTFNKSEYKLMKKVLYGVLTCSLFSESSGTNLFDYLNENC